MPRFLLVVTLIVVVASTIVTTGAFVPLACRSCREYKQQQRIDAAVEKSSSSSSNSRFGVTAAVAGRRAGMSMQLKPSSGTAPPFTTKEEQENDKGIKVCGIAKIATLCPSLLLSFPPSLSSPIVSTVSTRTLQPTPMAHSLST